MSDRPNRPVSARALLRLGVSSACCTLLLAGVAGCGSEDSGDDPGTATDPSSSESTTPESASPSVSPSDGAGESPSDSSSGSGGQFAIGDSVEPGQAVIVSASNVTGESSTKASALVDDQALDSFLSTTDARLAKDVRRAVKAVRVPGDSTLFGAVVAVGCHKPTAIEWSTTFDGIEVTPILPEQEVQCLVPVTSVALWLVPN